MYHFVRVRKTFTSVLIGIVYFLVSLFIVSLISLKMFNGGTNELTILLLAIIQVFILRVFYQIVVAPAFVKYEKR
ncbi:hypothetical protein K2V74_14685 [Mammaliicoccus sciuri]|uniref:hypothetical protein n=1 Tax=Mammaliicoccus sciuri TaxID=1296 RepID=UPI0005E3730D|nr:hypothetical protein [Mammaliicoccus sciuri]MCD8875564.1 hypothetical protein [Mammaliicoccus sciuri]CPQ84184.1 Uncharacterised protein [Staphylococcus aureus]